MGRGFSPSSFTFISRRSDVGDTECEAHQSSGTKVNVSGTMSPRWSQLMWR